MPWEIPIYICSRFAEALEQIYIPVWLFKQPPPLNKKEPIYSIVQIQIKILIFQIKM